MNEFLDNLPRLQGELEHVIDLGNWDIPEDLAGTSVEQLSDGVAELFDNNESMSPEASAEAAIKLLGRISLADQSDINIGRISKLHDLSRFLTARLRSQGYAVLPPLINFQDESKRIDEQEKARAMAQTGSSNRTTAATLRKSARKVEAFRSLYEMAEDDEEKHQIIEGACKELDLETPYTVKSWLMEDGLSVEEQRAKQINGFFDSAYNHFWQGVLWDDERAGWLEAWAERLYQNPAVEHYSQLYPEMRLTPENIGQIQHETKNLRKNYEGNLAYSPQFLEWINGPGIVGALNAYLYSYGGEGVEDDFEQNPELVTMTQDETTTIAELRDFLVRQEYIKLETKKNEVEKFEKMLKDIKARKVGSEVRKRLSS